MQVAPPMPELVDDREANAAPAGPAGPPVNGHTPRPEPGERLPRAEPRPLSDPPAPVSVDTEDNRRLAREADFTFVVEAGDSGELKVTEFSGTEGISELYCFRVELCADDDHLDLAAMLGQPCRLEIARRDGGEPVRYVHGMVRRFERTGAGSGLTHYAAEIVPVHWYLTKQHRCRIFQQHNCPDMSVPGIVAKVFAEAGLPQDSYRVELRDTYEPREYVVQYRESDLHFISRLMEEEGIFYYFEHTADGHRMVIADRSAACPIDATASEAVFRQSTGLAGDAEHVYELRDRCQIQTGSVTLDDFDFKRPPLDLQTHAVAERFTALELSDYPGRYLDRPLGERYARIRLEEEQCARRVLNLRANARTFRPGYRFTLAEHALEALNREYLVTRIEHRGRQSQSGQEEVVGNVPEQSYDAKATVLPSDIVYRPPCVTPRPAVQGSQTAIVVGPQDEEIYTDAYGRVKVQFHWDRAGAYDEHSSCWIRVSQGLAGGQYGMQFLPRVGQEVIVDFLEGNPDCPIITGRVYNNDHMPPYKLPEEKTRSGIKTRSTKGGGGANEIRFEDAKGKEQLFLHASRDMHVRVKHDQVETVESCRHATVCGNEYELVGKSRHTHVKLDLNEAVDGSISLKVGADVGEEIAGSHSETVANRHYLKAGQSVVIEAGAELTLKVGGNFVKIDAGGITILGKMVDINSGGSSGQGTAVTLEEAETPAPADKTEPGHDTRYGAEPVDGGANPDEEEKRTSWIELAMVDELGRPWPGEPYEIKTPDGKLLHGSLDKNGLAHVELREPGTCEICFPNIDAAAWEKV